MTTVRAPGLGPIIGHTTDKTCRLWMRAGDPADTGPTLAAERRTLGVVTLVQGEPDKRRPVPGSCYYFRLRREFDRTGVFAMGLDVALGGHRYDGVAEQEKPFALQPDTPYVVRLGSVTLDDTSADDEVISDAELARRLPPVEVMAEELCKLDPAESEASFRTAPAVVDKPSAPLAFIVGSCRYPGLLWKIKEADRIFGPMLRHLTPGDEPAARFSLMVGDQIYADLLNRMVPLARADTYGEFQERYLTAFGSTNMRRLLASAPTYMILDDHEIEDNWSQDRLVSDTSRELFNLAIGAYMSYQWSHGPRNYGRMLYYDFEHAGYPFFVLDTRTHRYRDGPGIDDNQLLGRRTRDDAYPSQLDRLLKWLTTQQQNRGDAPKFIVSSSVFVPSAIIERWDKEMDDANVDKRDESDSWPAFPTTRAALLDHILAGSIQNVVFLSGDIHCSNVAELWFERRASARARKAQRLPLRMFSVTSSAFYWPFPFADGDPNNYVHDSTDRATGQYDGFDVDRLTTMHYRAWAFTQEDNFCRIDVDPSAAQLRVRAFNARGEAVRVRPDDRDSRSPPLDNVLQLAPWI